MAMPNTPQACHVSKQSFGTETADADEALRLHNPIAPSSFQDIAQQCKTRQRSRKTGRWGKHPGCTDHTSNILEVPRNAETRSVAGAWPSSRSASTSSSAWPDVHQHRRKPINIKPRAPPDRTHLQLLITAHRRQDSRYDLDHCSLHLPGANATGDKHAGARPWCCCSLAYERGGQLHHGASRQQIMGHLCLRGVYLCPMAAASLDAKPSTLLGPSRVSLGRRDKDDGRDHDDDEEFSTPPPSCRGCPSRVDITTDQASAKRLDLMKRSFAPFVSSIRHGTRKPDVVL